jgi:hypothetical protein
VIVGRAIHSGVAAVDLEAPFRVGVDHAVFFDGSAESFWDNSFSRLERAAFFMTLRAAF